MLKYLNISNFVLIPSLQVELHEGLNLLTGETGSGKSIIVDALGLLLGGRSDAEAIRAGAQSAVVEGRFELTGERAVAVRQVLGEIGLELEGAADLIIRREISAQGRNRIFINDHSVTVGALRSVQPFLVEIHGQGEQRSLLSRLSHLELLDCFAGCRTLGQEVKRRFEQYNEAAAELRKLELEKGERERTGEMLRYQLRELAAIAPVAGEDEDLAAERLLLTQSEKAFRLSAEVFGELYESDQSVLARLAAVRRCLQELGEMDGRVQQQLESLAAAEALLADVAETMRGYSNSREFSPERLDEVTARLVELDRLKRKYGKSLPEIVEMRQELEESLLRLDNLAERELALRAAYESARQSYTEAAVRLSDCRRAALRRMEQRVMHELSEVAMGDAQFAVHFETAKPEAGDGPGAALSGDGAIDFFSPYGADRVEFLLSANPGEPLRPLTRVASGGELSRLMLTLRLVCLHGEPSSAGGETLVFDEIDAGIGGRAAEAVGQRLKALAVGRQIVCVTHQPQIARFADHHYAVSKTERGGRTVTIVRELGWDERVRELARMIGGEEEEATHAAARWLLESVRQVRGGAASGGREAARRRRP
jgi:DNA repair protein RecN (Recombination protein N)